MDPLRGRCHCGDVELELTPPTLFASYCHCESCRRIHGAPFVAWTAVPNERFQVRGDVAPYRSSPGVVRAFCPRCGTPLYFLGDDAPDRTYVPVAILDRLDRALDSHVSYEERAAWLEGVHALPTLRGKTDETAG